MRAEDVPADLVDAALQAEHEHERALDTMPGEEPVMPASWLDWWPYLEDRETLRQGTRYSLAGVWTEIQARILEEFADMVPGELSKWDRRYVEDWLRGAAAALREGPPCNCGFGGTHDPDNLRCRVNDPSEAWLEE